MFRRNAHTHSDRGSSAVEFAFVFPLLLLVIFAIIDFGRLEYTQIVVSSAAREGARANALGLSNWQDRAVTAAQPLTLTTSNVTANMTGCPANPNFANVSSSTIQVTVTKPFSFITPLSAVMRMFGGTGLNITQVQGKAAYKCLG